MKDIKCSYCGEEIQPRPKRIKENNFCSGKCRVAYHRLGKQIVTQYHVALDAIIHIGHAMTIRDDLTLQGDDLMSMLSNKMHEYQYDKLAYKINRLQRKNSDE